MAMLKLTAPWRIYYKELCALFQEDEEVHIIYDLDEEVDEQTINIYVDNDAKAEAMAQVLPAEKTFGSIVIQINVIPANKSNFKSTKKNSKTIYEDLFYNNPIVEDIIIVEGIFAKPIIYIVFKKEVVQYYNDSLSDAHGLCSTLYQDIADRILTVDEGVFFCTNNTTTGTLKMRCGTIDAF